MDKSVRFPSEDGGSVDPARVELLRPRLRGGRFDLGGGLPLEALQDVGGLRLLLVDIAKWYLRQRGGGFNQAVPRGFESSFQLNLSSVAIGSAELTITVTNAEPVLGGIAPPHVEVLEQASQLLVDTVGSMANQDPDATAIPPECLRRFAPFGRLLQEGEYMEIITPSMSEPQIYNRNVHANVMARAREEDSTAPVRLRGSVPEADQYRMRFELHPIGHRRLVNVIPISFFGLIMEAFNGYRDGVRVLVDGIGRYGSQGRLTGLDAITDIQLLDPLDIQSRIEELAGLRDGWLDGEGIAPDRDGLRWLSERFEEHYEADLPLPYLYPTYFGGVQAEWQFGSYELSLDMNLLTKQGEWFVCDTADSSTTEQALDLTDPGQWSWLVAELRRLDYVRGVHSIG